MDKQKYSEVYTRLNSETATLVFFKKNGDVRVMLGTRNRETISVAYNYDFGGRAMAGHDNRCNIRNGNIAVFDLGLGEARSFSIERLVDIKYHGSVTDNKTIDDVMGEFMKFKENYERTMPMKITLDSI